jgi:hypothetical protein
MRIGIVILVLICLIGSVSADQWCGVNILYFQHQNSPDVTGYEQLINYPSGANEVIESVVVQSTTGTKLIDAYISPAGSPNVTEIYKGLRRYRTFMYVDSATGITRLNFTPFIRYDNGTEKNIYTVMSDDINDLAVNEYLTSYTNQDNITFPTSARFGIRVSANTTHSSPIRVYWVYEGALHHSSVDSGFFVCDEKLDVNDVIPPSGSDKAIGILFGLIGGIIGSLILIKKHGGFT